AASGPRLPEGEPHRARRQHERDGLLVARGIHPREHRRVREDALGMGLSDLPVAREVPTVTAAQMAEIDRIAESELDISPDLLMTNASRQIAAATQAFMDEIDGHIIAALVGGGHNGGDALGALAELEDRGAGVDAYLAGPAERIRPLARARYDAL